ncbi:hypothetical protein VP01_497g1 [Puccinia sorghi]|uniref:Uncharacterized protein n=1 Tax=Puccinia sorghi TaxID=27349 RepID=A0A0L6ULU3_9BASI|nr:hypothetical protein VP01_497g1 [Puccinia sorghi]
MGDSDEGGTEQCKFLCELYEAGELIMGRMTYLYINSEDLVGQFKFLQVPFFGLVSLAGLCCVVYARSVFIMGFCSLAYTGFVMVPHNIPGSMFSGCRALLPLWSHLGLSALFGISIRSQLVVMTLDWPLWASRHLTLANMIHRSFLTSLFRFLSTNHIYIYICICLLMCFFSLDKHIYIYMYIYINKEIFLIDDFLYTEICYGDLCVVPIIIIYIYIYIYIWRGKKNLTIKLLTLKSARRKKKPLQVLVRRAVVRRTKKRGSRVKPPLFFEKKKRKKKKKERKNYKHGEEERQKKDKYGREETSEASGRESISTSKVSYICIYIYIYT